MKNKCFRSVLIPILVLVIASLACDALSGPAATSAPAPTEIVAPPTNPPEPTATLEPIATPDVAATQEYEDFYSQVKEYNDKGQVASLNGSYVTIEDFSESWPQIGWYQYWTVEKDISDFVFSSHFTWSTASSTPDVSGCGVVFSLQPNGDHYAVFLDKARVLVLHKDSSRGNKSYEVGKTRGSGRVNYSNPANADFSLAVKGNHAYVYVDKNFIGEYTLSADSIMQGEFDLTLLSGTNKDFGTKCEMTHSKLWIVEQ